MVLDLLRRLFGDRHVQHAVFVLRPDILFPDVADIIAPLAGETAFAVDIVVFLVLFALFALGGGNIEVPVFEIDVNILLIQTGQLHFHYIRIVRLFDIGAHLLLMMPPAVKRRETVVHRFVKEIVIGIKSVPVRQFIFHNNHLLIRRM